MRVLTEVKRDAILQAATEVFQEHGFERASMAQVSARIGGSKSTLYRYFSSKEELFLGVSHEFAQRHILPSLELLLASKGDLPKNLHRFSEVAITTIASETSIKMLRTVISESGRSDIGKRFHEAGPEVGMRSLAGFFQEQMDAGRMRQADAMTAARHLVALLESETVQPWLMGLKVELSKTEIRNAVSRAIDIFWRGYGVEEPSLR
ncbi:TetR/AcrR family transcriptional regulator [Pseudomonas corrugata]|uniref:TetR/AcrR family transcriptional regulator n=1 Tax=Pseudomonas corrugata TaxID=47879 RepID=UPI0015863940|nr:TetR/AcrR family transcriptional regulator [Pseudomonas corrugata]MCI0995190.1 TetR/AcrR family transcriptional regulator [Pseudomonas corrugata]NUT64657.1 TetR/AcrR family transcriptional regulator [Pseudomonas corrugata]